MKKLLMVLVVLVVAAGAFATSTFNITAKLTSSISISCAGTWAAGEQTSGAIVTMLKADAISVSNASTVAIVLSAATSDSTAWTANATADVNKFALTAAAGAAFANDAAVGTALASGTVLSSTPASLGSIGLTDSLVVAKLAYPTKSSTASSQSITVTLTAAAE